MVYPSILWLVLVIKIPESWISTLYLCVFLWPANTDVVMLVFRLCLTRHYHYLSCRPPAPQLGSSTNSSFSPLATSSEAPHFSDLNTRDSEDSGLIQTFKEVIENLLISQVKKENLSRVTMLIFIWIIILE